MIAVLQNNLEMVKMLIKNDANVNKTTKDGIGPLFMAIKNRKFNIAKFLVEKGA